MTIQELRKIISEDVTKAVTQVFRTEVRDILLEIVEKQEVLGESKASLEEDYTQNRSLSDILQETRKAMGREDYKNYLGSNSPSPSKPVSVLEEKKIPTMEGMPDFLAKAVFQAKKVLDLSDQKDKEKNGL